MAALGSYLLVDASLRKAATRSPLPSVKKKIGIITTFSPSERLCSRRESPNLEVDLDARPPVAIIELL